mmetsp:Transcript_17304/g.34433  ORF Transcript_17304/g.34433 Transcript_17304/m.34433 type:complete len:548 (+) Transcript_17304:1295-2938(+)
MQGPSADGDGDGEPDPAGAPPDPDLPPTVIPDDDGTPPGPATATAPADTLPSSPSPPPPGPDAVVPVPAAAAGGLTYVHASALWSHLVEHGSSRLETDQCLQAFHYVICQTGYYREEVRAYLVPLFFSFCRDRLPVGDIRGAAFGLFGLVLSFVNIYRGRLEPAARHPWPGMGDNGGGGGGIPTNSLRVVHFDVLGLDKMWEVVLDATCDEVAGGAMNFLSTIYGFRDVSPRIRSGVLEEQRKFIDRCISHLRGVVDANMSDGADVDATSVIRCLKLLSCFARNIMGSAKKLGILTGAAQSHGSLGLGQTLTVKIQYLGKPRFEVVCMTTDTVGMLRRLVREKVLTDAAGGKGAHDGADSSQNGGFTYGPLLPTHDKTSSAAPASTEQAPPPPTALSDYRLIFSGRELTHEQATLSNVGISNDYIIYCYPRLSQHTFGAEASTTTATATAGHHLHESTEPSSSLDSAPHAAEPHAPGKERRTHGVDAGMGGGAAPPAAVEGVPVETLRLPLAEEPGVAPLFEEFLADAVLVENAVRVMATAAGVRHL